MRIIDAVTLLLITFFVLGYTAHGQKVPETPPAQSGQLQFEQIGRLIERFKKAEHINLLNGAMWTVTHDYADMADMQQVLSTFAGFLEAMGKYEAGDSSLFDEKGGIGGFKNKLSEWLTDDDQAIRAFAAVLAGISGEKSFAPLLAELLNKAENDGQEFSGRYDGGRAAMALGMIGARGYLPQIIPLLRSKNKYFRSGAIQALTYFGAKEYSKEIAALLVNRELRVYDDPSPVYFLVEMGAAKEFKKELVQSMLDRFGTEISKASMYALVYLDSKGNAKDIAKLLKDRFKKGDAAKALALLNATEYSGEIAAMLHDDNGLVRSAAALALGVLGDKKYAKELAKLLTDKESYVHNYAATAILIMEAEEYYKEAVPVLQQQLAEGAYLAESAFHPLVAAKSKLIVENMKRTFEKLRSPK